MFGLVVFVFFGFLCGIAAWKNKTITIYLFGSISALGIGFLLAPLKLSPLYNAWQGLALRISQIITSIILICIFYFVISPAGIIKRIISGPTLPIRPDKKITTYWVKRTEAAQSVEGFKRRF